MVPRGSSSGSSETDALLVPKKNAGLFTGHDSTRGSGHGVFKMPRVGSVGSGSVQTLTGRVRSGRIGSRGFKSRGSGHRSGQEFEKKSRVRSGRVKNFIKPHGSGQVGSKGDEKTHGVGSGHDPQETGHSRVGPA